MNLFDAEIAAAVKDLEDRGEDEKARKVVIELTMLKVNETAVATEIRVAAKLPPRRGRGTIAESETKNRHTKLLFQSMNAERPDQPTFPALDKDGGEVEE